MITAPPSLHIVGPFATADGDLPSLASQATQLLVDGAMAYVVDGKGIWFLDKKSTSTPDGTNVVSALGGPGRWVKVGSLPSPP